MNALVRNSQQEIENIKKLKDIKIEGIDKDKRRIKELEVTIEEKAQYIEIFKEAGQRKDWKRRDKHTWTTNNIRN